MTTAVDRFLDAVRAGAIAECTVWDEDAVLDATVPNWRFQRRGPVAIRQEYAKWFADPGEFEQLRRFPTEVGEVVEYQLGWTENGVVHAAHHVHVLEVNDDRIVKDTVICGGRWPAPLLAEMAATNGE